MVSDDQTKNDRGPWVSDADEDGRAPAPRSSAAKGKRRAAGLEPVCGKGLALPPPPLLGFEIISQTFCKAFFVLDYQGILLILGGPSYFLSLFW